MILLLSINSDLHLLSRPHTSSSPFSPIKDCLVSMEMNSSVLDYANIYLLAFFIFSPLQF